MSHMWWLCRMLWILLITSQCRAWRVLTLQAQSERRQDADLLPVWCFRCSVFNAPFVTNRVRFIWPVTDKSGPLYPTAAAVRAPGGAGASGGAARGAEDWPSLLMISIQTSYVSHVFPDYQFSFQLIYTSDLPPPVLNVKICDKQYFSLFCIHLINKSLCECTPISQVYISSRRSLSSLCPPNKFCIIFGQFIDTVMVFPHHWWTTLLLLSLVKMCVHRGHLLIHLNPDNVYHS